MNKIIYFTSNLNETNINEINCKSYISFKWENNDFEINT